jgi:hypothetical protein
LPSNRNSGVISRESLRPTVLYSQSKRLAGYLAFGFVTVPAA